VPLLAISVRSKHAHCAVHTPFEVTKLGEQGGAFGFAIEAASAVLSTPIAIAK